MMADLMGFKFIDSRESEQFTCECGEKHRIGEMMHGAAN